jgi:hypothetical protein
MRQVPNNQSVGAGRDGELVGTGHIQYVMAGRLIDCYVVIREEGRQLKNSGENLWSIAGVKGGMGTILSLRDNWKDIAQRPPAAKN